MLYPEEQVNINLADHRRNEEMESVWTGGEEGERDVHCKKGGRDERRERRESREASDRETILGYLNLRESVQQES